MASSSGSLSQKLAQMMDTLQRQQSRDVDSLNTQEHAMSAIEMRAGLGTFIEEIFTDLVSVSSKLTGESTGTLHPNTFWQLLHICIQNFPGFLVEVVHRTPNDKLGLTKEKKVTSTSEPSKAFTVWVVSRIVRVLAEPGCSPLHDKAISFILSIAQLVKSKDLVFYRRIITEFVILLRDLVVIEETIFAESEVPDGTLPLHLDHFQFFDAHDLGQSCHGNSDMSKLTKKQICIKSEEGCSMIHEGISQIICEIVGDVCHYANDQVNLLWRTACIQLQTGISIIKQFALKILTDLLRHLGLPDLPILDQFIKTLCAVIDLCGSGICHSLPRNTVVELEKSLATCLNKLFSETSKTVDRKQSDNHWSEQSIRSPHHILPAWHLNLVYVQLSKTIGSGGLGMLQTLELKSCICDIIKYIYIHIPEDYSSSSESLYKHTISRALIQHVAMETDQQYMVGCLCKIINREDVKTTQDKQGDGMSKQDNVGTSLSSAVIPCKKARLSNLSQKKGVQNNKPGTSQEIDSTLALLMDKMDKLLKDIIDERNNSSINMESFLTKIEGVRVLLEIVSRSAKPLQDYLSNKRLQSCLMLLNSSLQILKQTSSKKEKDTASIEAVFKKLVHLVMMLFYVSDDVTLVSELQQCMLFVASIPWLCKVDQPWSDIPHIFGLSVQDMTVITAKLSPHIDKECLGDCLHQLAMFRSDTAPTWRSHVFMMSLQGSCDDITIQAIHWLPTLLCSLGSFSYSLVPDNLQKLLSRGPLIQKQIGKALGPLACVLTEHTLIRKWKSPDTLSPIGRCISLYCPVCDQNDKSSSNQHAVIDAAVFTPYLHLLSSTVNSAIKLAFISSIPRICTHLATTLNTSAHSCIVTATCCDLIEDPDYHVRLAFSKVISYVTRPGSNTGNPPLSVMTKLKKAFSDASTHSSHHGKVVRLQETVVLTIGQLGTTAEGELLLVVIVSLLKSLTAQSKVIRAKAFQQIQEIARCHSKPVNALFSEFKLSICKFVVNTVHDLQSTNPSTKESLDVITEVASVFEYRDIQTFVMSTLRFMIPLLVKKATMASSSVLRLLAKELKVSRREMLLENFKYIFSFLVRTCSPSELEKALQYVQKETDVELSSLLRSEAQSVYNQLLLYLSVSYDKVFSGLSMLASKDDTYTGPKDLKTADQMANFLQHRLLGILAFYNTILVTNSDLEEKKLALQSLVKLMEMMGPRHITSVRVKVMGILRLGLRFKDTGFPELSCDAWECFVRNIELSSLGPMLSELIVTLLPYLSKLPARVAKIYHFLIIENKSTLSEYFHEIYFLPDAPELKKVNAMLRTASGISSRKMDLKTQMKRALKGVAHENLDVRRHALSKLKQLLHDNQASIHDYVLSNETVAPIIPEIVSVLISRCHETDPESKLLVSECLGELGAVDPGRLDELTQVPVDEKPVFESGCEDMEFAQELITELARAFLAAHDTRAQDCSAYAIQEVLQVYGCSETKKEGPGSKLWRKFPEHIQEILRPHLYSKYLSSANPNWSRLAKPIYHSSKGKTFSDWASTWTSYMITKVKEQKPSRIFQACSKIFKHDIHTALFLLPHVIMYALMDGSQDDVNEIHAEIMSVLTHVQGNEDLPVSGSDFSHMSAQTIFTALDYLNRWTRKKASSFTTRTQSATSRNSRSGLSNGRENGQEIIQAFLHKIPQDVLSSASFNCKAYTRALMHFESFINKQSKDKQEHLGFLQKIYVALDEPDGVVGVAAIRNHEVTLHQQILEHESSGQLRDASACYESAIQEDPSNVDHHKGLLNCLMGLGQVTNALMHSNGIIAQRPEWKGSLNTFRVEAAWRLGQWDSLSNFLKMEKGRGDWNIGVGRILLSAKEMDEDSFNRQLRIVRSQQMGPLSAASMESGAYQRGYEYIARLHMLRELESFLGGMLQGTAAVDSQLFEGWKARLQITQKSFRTREQILNLRRAVLNMFPSTDIVKKEQGASWLQSAKIARKEGHVQAAFSSLLNASTFSLPQVCIERAKWLWSKGDLHQALLTLQKGVSTRWGNSSSGKPIQTETDTEKLIHAKALVLEGRWMEETAHYEPNPILKKFREVTDLHTNWENGHFYIGKYYDRLMLACLDEEKANKLSGADFIPFVIKHYGTSLQYGNKFIYQSMPRLLTIWLDFGAKVPDQGRSKAADKSGKRQKLQDTNKNMAELTDKLPAYQFFTAFSLLISRICHPNQKVVDQLEQILAKLLVTYPQQAIWMMMAVSKSSFATRVKRCRNIFDKAKHQSPALGKFINDATRLADQLLEVCNKGFNKNLARDNKMSMSHDFVVLKRLVSDDDFSPIIVPLQTSMTVTLPSGAGTHLDHNPFPDSVACITGFDDTVEVLSSLQRPKKITVKGSDGKSYIMMCKPRDDLRKDSRTMEFNGLINKCLRKDPDSRRRQLHIRTYAVIPLNEECGLIEWVKNTCGLRNILNGIYKDKNMYVKGAEVKKMIEKARSNDVEAKVKIFTNELLPRHPPVFHEWFLKTFPNPTSWYQSRISYCRTTAVMSMVGYILGLGDRHGENILFDSTNGDCVHVDLNCLFNKGETFDCPEKVPFRLTHNLVNAMGLLGCEGVYRRSCEVTLRLMREQCDSLLTVLGTFIYDPLVEWQKRGRDVASDAKSKETGEVTNEEAVKILKDIEQRLKGLNSKNRIMIPLSIEGQVHKLITEATDIKNLAQMYIGWAPYL